MIKRYLMLLLVLLGLSSCESAAEPSFEKIKKTELATYNASLPTDEQFVCREDIRGFIGGRYQVLPKLCLTVRELRSSELHKEEAIDWRPLCRFSPGCGNF